MKVKVAAPYQVAHAEKIYRPGDVADVPDEVAHHWLASGWVNKHVAEARKATD